MARRQFDPRPRSARPRVPLPHPTLLFVYFYFSVENMRSLLLALLRYFSLLWERSVPSQKIWRFVAYLE